MLGLSNCAAPTSQLASVIGALLLAGEFECGVADADPEAAHSCELLTDQIADALLTGEAASIKSDFQKLTSSANFSIHSINAVELRGIFLPLSNSASPLLKVLLITHFILWRTRMSFEQIPACDRLLVVGIRSIGTT